MSKGPQKPDHGGNFIMVPRQVIDCVAWRCASMRARVLLQILHARHNGFNNGEIAAPIKELSAAIGDQNHGATSKALAELIGLGFIECMSDASHSQAKARTYRITFIPTGEGKRAEPATKDFLHWRPQPGMRRSFGGARTDATVKFGGAVTTTRTADSVTVTATPMKFRIAETTTRDAVTAGFCDDASVAVTVTLIGNHPEDRFVPSEISSRVAPASIWAQPDELRDWARTAIDMLGYGGAKQLAVNAGISEPAMSRFRQGKSLPDEYHRRLHEACARVLPYSKFRRAS